MQFEPELLEVEKKLRVQFVDEFFHDRNPTAAARRVGFMGQFAADYAKRFMEESFVRKLIKERENQLTDPTEENIDAKRRMVEQALIREANFFGPGSTQAARVQALTKLAALYKMETSSNPNENDDLVGNVMVVPAMSDPDTWASGAAAQQQRLKETVKD